MSATPMDELPDARISRRKSLAAVIACIVIYGLTIGFTTPLIAIILEARGVGSTLIGLNAAMPSLSLLLFSVFVPRYVQALGMRRFLVWCLVADVLLLQSLILFDSLVAWFVIRLVMGVTLGGLFIVAEAWINAITPDATRGRVIARYNAIYYVASATGASLILMTGSEGALPFVVAGALILIAALPLYWARDEGQMTGGSGASLGFGEFMGMAPMLVMAVALFAIIEFTSSPLLPVYALRSGMTQEAAALCLTAVGVGRVIMQIPIGRVADTWDRERLLALCIALTLIFTLMLPLAISLSPWGYIMLVLWGGAYGGIYTVAQTIVGQRFQGQHLMVANAALAVVWGAGGIAGPGIAGVAMDIWDPHGMIAVIALACAATLAGMAVLRGKDESK